MMCQLCKFFSLSKLQHSSTTFFLDFYGLNSSEHSRSKDFINYEHFNCDQRDRTNHFFSSPPLASPLVAFVSQARRSPHQRTLYN